VEGAVDTPAYYHILVKERIGPAVAGAFPSLTVRYTRRGETLLAGYLPDQAALHGVLARIRDFGLTLIALRRRRTHPDHRVDVCDNRG
jgi:hypothetical protein